MLEFLWILARCVLVCWAITLVLLAVYTVLVWIKRKDQSAQLVWETEQYLQKH